MTTIRSQIILPVLAAAALATGFQTVKASDDSDFQHVLLISVDGLHAVDVENFVASHPHSAFARLCAHGVKYTQASTSKPSDSFPGLVALVTGGSPAVTGVYYDDSFDRKLLPPLIDGDGNPLGGTTPGTEVVYDETIDKDLTRPDAGGGINPDRLPRDPVTGAPVYPHSFLRVNTIFEVAKSAHLRTAWSDKHPAYDLVNGPSGQGVDDLFCPEINSNTPESASSANPVVTTSSVKGTENYDDTKVAAVLNEIHGYDHAGVKKAGTPAIFGLNFQAVSVGQKLVGNVNPDGSAPVANLLNGGYVIDAATGNPRPSPLLEDALIHTDASLGRILDALDERRLAKSTLVILTAKHGQSPMDIGKLKSGLTGFKLKNAIKNLIAPVAPIAQLTEDDVALVWLQNPADTAVATAALQAGQSGAFIQSIYSGTGLTLGFPDPTTDSRVPNIIIQPELGVIYSNSTAKDAEHGGFALDDVNVALILSNPAFEADTLLTPVQTTQVAPTILKALGLNPHRLNAVELEGTQVLPGLGLEGSRR